MSDENPQAVAALLKKARTALSDAELLMERGSPEAAINRAYYTVVEVESRRLQTPAAVREKAESFLRKLEDRLGG